MKKWRKGHSISAIRVAGGVTPPSLAPTPLPMGVGCNFWVVVICAGLSWVILLCFFWLIGMLANYCMGVEGCV